MIGFRQLGGPDGANMENMMQDYLIIWNPTEGWPHTVETLRVVGALATDGGLEQARKTAFRNSAEYAQEINGQLRVVKSDGPEYLVESKPSR